MPGPRAAAMMTEIQWAVSKGVALHSFEASVGSVSVPGEDSVAGGHDEPGRPPHIDIRLGDASIRIFAIEIGNHPPPPEERLANHDAVVRLPAEPPGELHLVDRVVDVVLVALFPPVRNGDHEMARGRQELPREGLDVGNVLQHLETEAEIELGSDIDGKKVTGDGLDTPTEIWLPQIDGNLAGNPVEPVEIGAAVGSDVDDAPGIAPDDAGDEEDVLEIERVGASAPVGAGLFLVTCLHCLSHMRTLRAIGPLASLPGGG